MAIVLIGVPGAGKSTVGRLLAQQLGCAFVDTDNEVEAQAGKSISEIFIQDGEPAFRTLEKAIIGQALDKTDAVIAVGGGALLDADTRSSVKQHECIWLQTNLNHAVDRVGMNKNRPLLLGNVRGQLADLMSAREPLYIECATLVVDTNDLTPAEVVQNIIDKRTETLGK